MSRMVGESSTRPKDDGQAGILSLSTRREREALSTFANLISTFSDFLNTAIHQILYERDIYPKEMFQDRNKYNLAIKQSMYYKVNKWITDAVKACSEELLQNSVKRISVVILSPSNEPLERFVFDMSSFPSVPADKHHVPLLLPVTQVPLPRQTLAALEAQFRACLLKLKFCSVSLGKLPEDCTIGVVIELHENGTPKNVKPICSYMWCLETAFPLTTYQYLDVWMPDERQSTSKDTNSLTGSAYNGIRTTPIRTVETGVISMGVWIEETAGKVKLAGR